MTKIEIHIDNRGMAEQLIENLLDWLEDYPSYKLTIQEDNESAWGYEKLPNTITTQFTQT